MELILWRHADAAPGDPDESRALTDKGRKQAKKIAQWLEPRLPQGCGILSSPAIRTVQTAEALDRKFKTHPDLGTGTTPEKLLAATGWPNGRDPVLVVGHQPTLGQVAALLMTGTAQDWTMRKASIWWFAQQDDDDGSGFYLKAVIGPSLA